MTDFSSYYKKSIFRLNNVIILLTMWISKIKPVMIYSWKLPIFQTFFRVLHWKFVYAFYWASCRFLWSNLSSFYFCFRLQSVSSLPLGGEHVEQWLPKQRPNHLPLTEWTGRRENTRLRQMPVAWIPSWPSETLQRSKILTCMCPIFLHIWRELGNRQHSRLIKSKQGEDSSRLLKMAFSLVGYV